MIWIDQEDNMGADNLSKMTEDEIKTLFLSVMIEYLESTAIKREVMMNIESTSRCGSTI